MIMRLLLIAMTGLTFAQTRQVLFDGKTLTGWHYTGTGVWTVKDSCIHASNPPKDWGHLIWGAKIDNAYIRVKYKNIVGNTGIYVRGTEGGIYGFQGMQVDLGGINDDGSVMRVTDTSYTWFQELSKARDSGYIVINGWNELGVDVQGMTIKTYINGHLIWTGTNIPNMLASGLLSLQTHAGDDNDVYFKDIVVFTPTRMPYCPDVNDIAYTAGNDPNPSLCKGVVGIYRANHRRSAEGLTGWGAIGSRSGMASGAWTYRNPDLSTWFNLQGASIPAASINP